LRASDVIWSFDTKKRGPICSRMVYADVKSLRERDFNDPEKEIMARIQIFSWLRNADEMNIYKEYILPDGFDLEKIGYLPTQLVQTG
jgi:hypothetical protein